MDTPPEDIPRSHTELLHQVFDQATIGFQVIDTDWRYVFANQTVAKQAENTPDALVGHTMMEMYPGIEKTPLFTQLKKCMDERVGIHMKNEFVFPDGKKVWFQLFIHPWSGGIMIFSVDINEHKLAEQKLVNLIEAFPEASLTDEGKKRLGEIKHTLGELVKN